MESETMLTAPMSSRILLLGLITFAMSGRYFQLHDIFPHLEVMFCHCSAFCQSLYDSVLRKYWNHSSDFISYFCHTLIKKCRKNMICVVTT